MDEKEYYTYMFSHFEYKHLMISLFLGILLLVITKLPGYSLILSSFILGYFMENYTFDFSFIYATIVALAILIVSYLFNYTTWIDPSVDFWVILICIVICVFIIWFGFKISLFYIEYKNSNTKENVESVNDSNDISVTPIEENNYDE